MIISLVAVVHEIQTLIGLAKHVAAVRVYLSRFEFLGRSTLRQIVRLLAIAYGVAVMNFVLL